MQHIVIKILLLSITLFMFKCTNVLNSDPSAYNSIHLKGGGWLQFNGVEINSYLNNDFSLQLWISGDTDQSSNSKTLLSILDDSDNQVIFGLFRNTTVDNGIDVYFYGDRIKTITSDDIDWTKTIFNLLTITSEEEIDSENNLIKIFINDTQVFSNQDSDSQVDINLQLGDNNLIIGGKVNSSQTVASNFWTGYIDEIRLWDAALTTNEISFHFTNPYKIITMEDDSETEDIVEGSYEDERLCNLVGLWRFNYNSPTSHISDESCLVLDLSSGTDNHLDECIDCENINGMIYTLPGYNIEFSKISL